MRKLPYLISIVAAATLTSCGYYYQRKGEDEVSNQKKEATLDFASVKARIFDPRCASCHSQFANYAAVKRELPAISSSVNSGRMPKVGGPLSASEKSLLFDWINIGAPQFADRTPVEAPEELLPVWGSIFDHIVASHCLVCHNPNGQAKFLDLSTRDAFLKSKDRMFDGKKLLDSEHPDESYLIEVIEDPIEPMPPVWSSIPRLTKPEIEVLKEWIKQGMP